MIENNIGVHKEHCSINSCKYGDEDCPVVNLDSKLKKASEKLTEEEIAIVQDHWYQVGRSAMADKISQDFMKKAQHAFGLGDDELAKEYRSLYNKYKEIAESEHPRKK